MIYSALPEALQEYFTQQYGITSDEEILAVLVSSADDTLGAGTIVEILPPDFKHWLLDADGDLDGVHFYYRVGNIDVTINIYDVHLISNKMYKGQ